VKRHLSARGGGSVPHIDNLGEKGGGAARTYRRQKRSTQGGGAGGVYKEPRFPSLVEKGRGEGNRCAIVDTQAEMTESRRRNGIAKTPDPSGAD